MALSIFLRHSTRSSILLNNHISRLVVPAALLAPGKLTTQSRSSFAISRSSIFKDVNSVPLTEVVRNLRTTASALHLKGHGNEKPHDHARLWVIEWYVSLVNMVMVPVGLLMPNKLVDIVIAITLSAHAFWGLQAIMVEYVRVILFGNVLPVLALGLVYAIASILLGGFFYLTFNGDGITGSFWKFWSGISQCKTEKPPPGPC